jgi:hypothetical protein
MECPVKKKWNDLPQVDKSSARMCDTCSRTVTDTKTMTDQDLTQFLFEDPHACLMVNLNQSNCKIIL